jgi:hypothetical protein
LVQQQLSCGRENLRVFKMIKKNTLYNSIRSLYTQKLFAGIAGIGGIGYWIYSLDNHKKILISSNTLFKSIKSHVKSCPEIKKLLGNSLEFPMEKVEGNLNIIKGTCDISCLVVGDKDEGVLRFKGRKIAVNQWESEIFQLHSSESRVIL